MNCNFSCSENVVLESGFCIFHDSKYHEQCPDKIKTSFEKKMNDAIQNKTPLMCVGYHLFDVNCENRIFDFDVFFEDTKFHGSQTNFSRTKFFGSTTSFIDAHFYSDKTLFGFTVFGGEDIDFMAAVFNGEETEFSNAEFQVKEISFNGTKFNSKRTGFGMTIFMGDVTRFDYSEFNGEETEFQQTKFNSLDTCFYDVQFNGKKTWFLNAEFNGEETTFRSKFYGSEISFYHSQFCSKETNFESEFRGQMTHFEGTKFNGENASFSGSKFYSDETTFKQSQFHNKFIDFSDTRFAGIVSFAETKFKHFTSFRNVNTNTASLILFDSDLSNVSFYETKIGSNIKFGLYTKWNNHNKIYDEMRLENDSSENMLVSGIISQYQDLRDNYEFNFNYDEAGKFFIRESEILRNYEDPKPLSADINDVSQKVKSFFKNTKPSDNKEQKSDELKIKKKNKWSRYVSISFVYKNIADYGESYKKPLGILVMIFLYTVISSSVSQYTDNNLNLIDASTYGVSRALGAFVPYLDVADTTDKPWDYAVKAIALPLTGLAFIALKRRFERKYRNTVIGN